MLGLRLRLMMDAAMSNIKARRDAHQRAIISIVEEVLANAKVMLAGGIEVQGLDLKTVFETALPGCIVASLPPFSRSGPSLRGIAFREGPARGSDPLGAIGYSGDASQHPVCKEVLAHVGVSGKQGTTFAGTSSLLHMDGLAMRWTARYWR